MTRLLELYYLIGVPLGLVALVWGIAKKRRRIALLATAVAMIGIWALTVSALTARYTLLHEHYNSPRVTSDIIRTFGKPEATINYKEGDSVWFYYIRVWPWCIETSYSVYMDRILGLQTSEHIAFSYKPELSAQNAREEKHVRLFLATRDKITWVILPDDKKDEFLTVVYKEGRWMPTKEDIPGIINAAYKYVKEFTGDPEGPKTGKSMSLYWQRIISEIIDDRSTEGCQVVGYMKNGRKMIHLNFFPRLEDDFTQFAPGTTEPYWHTRYEVVNDGGPRFWQIEYDPATKTFSNFRANGMG
jgi:hypothetical protein